MIAIRASRLPAVRFLTTGWLGAATVFTASETVKWMRPTGFIPFIPFGGGETFTGIKGEVRRHLRLVRVHWQDGASIRALELFIGIANSRKVRSVPRGPGESI